MHTPSKTLIAVGCMAAAVAATSANAANVSLVAGDGFGATSFNTGTRWSDGTAPNPGNDYFVDNGLLLRTPPPVGNYTFGGDSLTLGPNGGSTDGAVFMPGGNFGFKTEGGGGIITINNLILNGGTIRHIQGTSDVFTLAGNVNVLANSLIWAKQGPINITAAISGSGTVTNPTSDGPGRTLTFSSSANTFTGSLVNNGRFHLAENALFNFAIGASGISNSISGTGAETALNGVFLFDLSGASTEAGSSWSLVTASNRSFGETFSVSGFTNNGGGVWSSGIYQFTQSSGTLEVIPEPSTYALLFGALVLLGALTRRRLQRG
jgi:hypothetical protein